MRKLEPTDQVTLENLIDITSLSVVLDAISQICQDKAQHIQEDWQDSEHAPLVKFWTINSKCFDDHSARVRQSERKLKIDAR